MPENDLEQFLYIFLQENSDRFETLNHELVALEENPSDEERLYTILRHVHSLKGSAGMFGFDNLKQVAHRLEDLMVKIHQNPSLVTREVMDALFEGCDVLQLAFRRITNNEDTSGLTAREKAFLEHLQGVISSLDSGGGDLIAATTDLLANMDGVLAGFEGVVDLAPLREDMQRVRTLLEARQNCEPVRPKGNITLGGKPVGTLFDALYALLERGRAQGLTTAERTEFFAELRRLLEAARGEEAPALAEIVQDAADSVDIFGEMDLDFDSLQAEYYSGVLAGMLPFVKEVAAEEVAAGRKKEAAVAAQRKTVRIEETKIDAFLESVGEMIILGEVFNNLQKRLSGLVGGTQFDLMREFKSANADFSKQVFQLQGALMDIRRVELRNVTASLSRLVRDTAGSLGKRIDLVIEGEGAVIDKSLLDEVNACLVHIVRNACDHGIETPQQRQESGKTPEGTIRVNACNEDDHLILKVSDDGRGIDVARIRQRALEQGLFSERELAEMSERQLRELVFRNGLSTAAAVSDISGRGVGMSSVLENIGKSGGSIELKSELGRGTEVVMRIPLSIMLSVLDGLVVSSGGRGFILPIRSVSQTISLQGMELLSYQGRGRCVELRGRILPVLRLESYLGDGAAGAGLTGVVVRSSEGAEFCLAVDEILDHQQVVIKRIDGLESVPGILGGALLGDGTIGLVLNPDYFAALCQ